MTTCLLRDELAEGQGQQTVKHLAVMWIWFLRDGRFCQMSRDQALANEQRMY